MECCSLDMKVLIRLTVLIGLISVARAEDEVLARFEVAAPDLPSFILHGTLPVPHGELAAQPKGSPFSIQSRESGVLVGPTQLEVVSRYPDGTPDVVELLARVHLPKNARPGSPVRYDVVRRASETRESPRLSGDVRALLKEPGQVRVRGEDVFGNRYELDLLGHDSDPGYGSRKRLKIGGVSWQYRAYGTMTPRAPPSEEGEPLPHLLGVHSYITTWEGESFVGLDLRFNNGAASGSRGAHPLESPLGIVYWKSLELVVPKAWIAVPKINDPFWGRPRAEGESFVYSIVAANEDGKLHMMGPQAQFSRRLVLTPRGTRKRARLHLDGVGHAFCVRGSGLWSWFNENTGRYFPQRHVLASLDFWRRGKSLGKSNVRAEDWRRTRELEEVLRTGKGGRGYAVSDVMGWAHPWFIRIEGGAGGEGIAMFEGHRAAGAASVGDYVRLELLHRMNMARQPEAAYDRFGEPLGYHAWLRGDGKIPFDFRTNAHILPPPFRLPMRDGPPASAQVREVVKRGLRPAYDRGTPFEKKGNYPGDPKVLLAWSPHDGQHMIRYTKNTKALVWLGNDALAKDDLLLSAELFRLMWHESPHVPASWSEGITLRVQERIATEFPHTGIHINRDHAWGIDSMCAAYSTASMQWRAKNFSWFSKVAEVLDLAAMPNGIVQRNEVNSKILGHTRYAAAQGFEVLFLVHSMRALTESVFRGVDEDATASLEALALRCVDYLFFGPVFRKFQTPYQPDPQNPTRFVYGPLAAIPVSLNDGRKTPPFSDVEHWGEDYLPDDFVFRHVDTTYVWEALSFAHEISEDTDGKGLANRYLRRTLSCSAGFESYRDLLRNFYEQSADASLEDSKNWIGLVGKLQNLGVR